MKELKGTKTEQNLINAFAGESQARNRYTYFAKQAKNEGYEQIAEIFLQTAENEKEHAKLFYKHIGNTIGNVNASYPFEFGTTEENIKNNTVFSKSADTYWLCLKCGYVHFGKSAPEKCPNCHHPKAYFQVLCENY